MAIEYLYAIPLLMMLYSINMLIRNKKVAEARMRVLNEMKELFHKDPETADTMILLYDHAISYQDMMKRIFTPVSKLEEQLRKQVILKEED